MNCTDDTIASPGGRLGIDGLHISQMRRPTLPAVPMKTRCVYIAVLTVVYWSSGIDSREHHEGEPLQAVEICSRIIPVVQSTARSRAIICVMTFELYYSPREVHLENERTASLSWGDSDGRNFRPTPSRKHVDTVPAPPGRRYSIRDNVVYMTPCYCPGGNS